MSKINGSKGGCHWTRPESRHKGRHMPSSAVREILLPVAVIGYVRQPGFELGSPASCIECKKGFSLQLFTTRPRREFLIGDCVTSKSHAAICICHVRILCHIAAWKLNWWYCGCYSICKVYAPHKTACEYAMRNFPNDLYLFYFRYFFDLCLKCEGLIVPKSNKNGSQTFSLWVSFCLGYPTCSNTSLRFANIM